jgi:hypothetical protein
MTSEEANLMDTSSSIISEQDLHRAEQQGQYGIGNETRGMIGDGGERSPNPPMSTKSTNPHSVITCPTTTHDT